MPDILIRDLPERVVQTIDAHAKWFGLSRSEYLRKRMYEDASWTPPGGEVTVEDFRRFSELAKDLTDPEFMASAWGTDPKPPEEVRGTRDDPRFVAD